MALHHFGYLSELGNHIVEFSRFAQVKSHIRACLVAYGRRVYYTLRAENHTGRSEALYALVHGRAAHSAFAGYFKIRSAGIGREHSQDIQVE